MIRRKILFLVTRGNWGGAQKYVFDLATALPKKQFEVVVASGEGETLSKKLKAAGIKSRRLVSSKRRVSIIDDGQLFLEIWRLLWQERPAVVHLNSSKIGLIGAAVARFFSWLAPAGSRPKILFTAHGWAFNEDRPKIQKVLLRLLSWLTIIFCHQVIVINRREFNQVKNWWRVKPKLVLIYNGIRSVNFLPKNQARAFLTSHCQGETLTMGVWVGTIAELTRNKGLDYLATAYPGGVIIGEGEERENLTNQIKLLGAIPEAEKYLKAFDIFVLPSRKEGLPYSILEAGLAGLPVIASDVGGLSEIIEDNVSGLLVPAGDTAKLKLAIEKLIADPALWTKLGLALQQKVQTQFSFAQMLNQTTALYCGPTNSL